LVVQQLRAIKQRRQVIVITHNANIVVNGDAELVVALAARSGQTQIEAQGSLQERTVRDTICNTWRAAAKRLNVDIVAFPSSGQRMPLLQALNLLEADSLADSKRSRTPHLQFLSAHADSLNP
jgi:ubiquinone biosynthesis protein UbiJ